jgi:hypothetical protein
MGMALFLRKKCVLMFYRQNDNFVLDLCKKSLREICWARDEHMFTYIFFTFPASTSREICRFYPPFLSMRRFCLCSTCLAPLELYNPKDRDVNKGVGNLFDKIGPAILKILHDSPSLFFPSFNAIFGLYSTDIFRFILRNFKNYIFYLTTTIEYIGKKKKQLKRYFG